MPSGAGAEAIFNFSNNVVGNAIVGIPDFATITLGTLNFTSTGSLGMILRGSLSDGGVSDGTLIFNGNGSNAQVNINNNVGTGVFQISGAAGLVVQLATSTNFNVVNAGGLAILDAATSGAGMLIKSGAGTLRLLNANSFTGGISIQGGTLQAGGDASLGTGQVTISNNATFRSAGVINQTFATNSAQSGIAGSAQIVAAAATVMTLTGTLNHLSTGTVTFGSATDTGTIIASFASIGENALISGYQVSGGTLQFGNAFSAANLFNRPGQALTEITNGGVIDTNGFATIISNLDFDSGTLRSSSGVVNVTVNDGGVFNSQTGTLEGTAGVDSFTVNAVTLFSLSALTLLNWTAGTDEITLNGNGNNNNLTGSSGRDSIYGFGGADVLIGNGGIDTIVGDAGNDLIILIGANSGSFVFGGADTDTLQVSGSLSLGGINGFEALDLVTGASLTLSGTQFASGFNLFSTLTGSGTINVNITAANRVVNARGMSVTGGSDIHFAVVGTSGADIVKVALGATSNISGGVGTDQLIGGNLVDTINGGDDIDKIRGGGGADLLTGGSGADVFKFRDVSDSGTGANADTIVDFVSGTDRLNFGRIDTNPNVAGDQGFAFVGTGAFSGGGVASIRWVDLGADLRVEADANGDGVADMHIILQGAGAQTLTIGDFVL